MIPILTLFLSVFVHRSFVAGEPGLWDINIDRDPAPAPDKGPPLSADADRDPSHLKCDLAYIFGAYAVWIFLTILLIVFVGWPLRRRAQFLKEQQPMEMLKPRLRAQVQEVHPERNQPSITSPKMSSLKSWAKGHKSSPSEATVSSVDTRVVEQDRAKNMDEMAKLYAAVMADDEVRSHKPQHSTSTGSSLSETQHSPVIPRSPLVPPEFQHLRQQQQQLNHPMAPTPYEQPYHDQVDDRYGPTPGSFVSAGTTRVASSNSTRSGPSRVSVRGQPISRPVGHADLNQSVEPGLPQSPRMYNPGPPPPTPGRARPTTREGERKAPPAALSFDNSQAASGSSNSLPFRQFYSNSLRSAPATKTTFVEPKSKNSGPKTGVPQTPYSPYTPYTPMTPITPGHLPSKQELKQSRKKHALKPLKEDEMVKSDQEMWE